MAPTSRIVLALLAVTGAGLMLCAALVYGSLDYLSLRTAEASIDFRLGQLRDTIEANVGLGLPLSDVRVTQDLLERTRAADGQVLALEVFSPGGISLFNTDRGSIGEPIPPLWRDAIGFRIENDRWQVEQLGDIVVGQVIRNDFGEAVGYLAITISGEARQQHARSVLSGLARRTAVVLPVACLLALALAAALFRYVDKDVSELAALLASGRQASGPQGLAGRADDARKSVERAVQDFDTATAEVLAIDEAENREAA